MAKPSEAQAQTDAAVVTQAVKRAAVLLELKQQELSQLLHVSPATTSRLMNGKAVLEVATAEGQMALLFLRAFRSLDTLVGGNSAKAAHWLRAQNDHLGGVPLDRMGTPEGMAHVAGYLDAMRGKA